MIGSIRTILIVAALSASGCQSSGLREAQSLTISNFTFGLMTESGGTWNVYEKGTDFVYRPNGECVANSVRMPCMWWGYTFEYQHAVPGAEIPCALEYSRPQRHVNPTKDFGVSTRKTYSIRLESRNGVHRALGYQTSDGEAPGKLSITTTCTWNGRTLFEFTKSVEFSAS
jgi:hypothetical protein